jgi:GTPase SAR1 family protein
MAIINVGVREIHCKIVYYGPGMCGKTSNLQYIHSQVPREAKGDLLSIATETERTLFFDFLPLDLGKVRGFLNPVPSLHCSRPNLIRTHPRGRVECADGSGIRR